MNFAEWGWPQWTLALLMALSLWANVNDHGKPRGPSNANIALIALCIEFGLLYAGGFWS